MRDFTIIAVGQSFPLVKHLPNTQGTFLEYANDNAYGQLFLVNLLSRMTKEEANALGGSPISVGVLEEYPFLLTFIRYGSLNLLFELSFDPTLYKDRDPVNYLVNANLLYDYAVEATTGIVQAMRVFSIPQRLHEIWLRNWSQARKEPDFSVRYARWRDDLDRRYPLPDLYERAVYVGKMGQRE